MGRQGRGQHSSQYLVVLKEKHNKVAKGPAWAHALQDWPRPTLCQICILHLPLKRVHHGLGLLLHLLLLPTPQT